MPSRTTLPLTAITTIRAGPSTTIALSIPLDNTNILAYLRVVSNGSSRRGQSNGTGNGAVSIARNGDTGRLNDLGQAVGIIGRSSVVHSWVLLISGG